MNGFELNKDYDKMLKSMDAIFGTEESRYEGELRNGLPHGKGTMYVGKDKWECEWNNGRPGNKVKLTFADGHVFDVTMPRGHGIIHDPAGVIYEGEVSFLMKHGKGVMKFPDGSRVVGTWKNDLPHGQATMYLEDGSIIDFTCREGGFESFSFRRLGCNIV